MKDKAKNAGGRVESPKGKAILAASTEVFLDEGFASFSLRRVAQAMGISLGTLQYYFPTLDDLLGATLVGLMNRANEEVHRIASGPEAVEDRIALVCGFVIEVNRQQTTSQLIFEALSLAQRNAMARRIVADSYNEYRSILARLIAEASPQLAPGECLVRATMIASLLEGLVIFSYPGGPDPIDWNRATTAIRNNVFALVYSDDTGRAHS